MNTILVVTTIFALAIAALAGIALFVAFRDERRRSRARVEALREMSEPEVDYQFADPLPLAAEDFAPVDDLTYDDPAPGRAMFVGEQARSPWGRRLAAAAVVALILLTAGYVLLPRGTEAPQQATAPASPLELLSLRHAQEDGRLVITGLVQNPRTGSPLSRVVATAFLFAADGTFLASGRAPLDFSTLAAGDESPFVVAVPVTSPVARYRIGFRSEDGRVIGHIDRRSAGTMARARRDPS
jgi:hypothetical protein